MAFTLKDRVKETVTVSGTGPVTLPGVALTGFQTFTATLADGATTWYAIVDNLAGGWEVGLGTWASATTRLTRTTVFASSNGGSAVNFPGNGCDVFQDLPASQIASIGGVTEITVGNGLTGSPNPITTTGTISLASAAAEFSVLDYGAVPDLVSIPDGVMSNGSTLLTSATGGFVAGMVGKVIEVSGALGVGPPLLTTVASVTNTNTLNTVGAATAATGTYFFRSAIVADPDGTVSGSYIPGTDTLTIGTGGSGTSTGGTYTVQAVVLVESTNVRDLSFAVVNAGSLGTDGRTILTATTGTGDKAQFRATITSGTLDASSLSLYNPGIYTANPTDLSAEPVTSDMGLTGATLSFAMDVRTVSTSVAGTYTVVPTQDAAGTVGVVSTGAGSSSGATGAILDVIWGSTGRTQIGTNNLTAFSNAITAVNTSIAANTRVCLGVPAGNYGLWSGTLPNSTQALMALGDGSGVTQIYTGEGYASAHVFGFVGLFPGNSVQTNNGPNTLVSETKRGGGVMGIGFYGNTTATNVPSAIVLYDRDDGMEFDDIYVSEMRSILRMGILVGSAVSYARESTFGKLEGHVTGVGGFPSIEIATAGANARPNNLIFHDVILVAPLGVGISCTSTTSVSGVSAKQITFGNVRIERGNNSPTGDMIQFGSATDTDSVGNIVFTGRTRLISPQSGASAIGFYGSFLASIPKNVVFKNLQILGGRSFGKGITVNAGEDLHFELTNMQTGDTNITVASRTDHPRSGTIGSGSTTSAIKLDSGASSTTDQYVGGALTITSTVTGTASFAAGVMTVTAATTTAGQFRPGTVLTSGGLTFGTTITSQLTGTTGGTGTYAITSNQTISSRAVSGVLQATRSISAYNGSTKTATVIALQGSAATYPWTAVSGETFNIFSLVEARIAVTADGQEANYSWSVGANSGYSSTTAPGVIQTSIYPQGQPGLRQLIAAPYNFTDIQIDGQQVATVSINVAQYATVQAALTAAAALAVPCEVYFPAGTYTISSLASITTAASQALTLRGAGAGVTTLSATSNGGALAITLGSASELNIFGMTIIQNAGSDGGVGVAVTSATFNNGPMTIRDVKIIAGTKSFASCLTSLKVFRVIVSACHFVTATTSAPAVSFDGATPTPILSVKMSSCFINGGSIGLLIGNGTDSWCQGVQLTNCNFINQPTNIKWYQGAGFAADTLTLDDCLFNYTTTYCIDVQSLLHLMMNNCYIIGTTGTMLHAVDPSDGVVTGCTFFGNGHAVTGIDLSGTSATGGLTIAGNSFFGFNDAASMAVNIGASVQNTTVIANGFPTSSAAFTITDAGTNNLTMYGVNATAFIWNSEVRFNAITRTLGGLANTGTITSTGNIISTAGNISAQGSANNINLIGSAGTAAVSLTATGSATNLNLQIVPKGTGAVSANGPFVVQGPGTGNDILLAGKAAGTTPTIVTQGADTDIGMILSPKGTGAVNMPIGNAPASAAAAGVAGDVRFVSGFIYICVANNTWQRVAIATF